MNPILLQIGPFSIRYYGILMALGFIIGYFITIKLSKDKIEKEVIQDFFVYFVITTIIGARLFHVLVYNFNYFYNNPIKIFYIWEGGLASHGAVIAGILVVLWFSKKRKINFYDLADIVVIPTALAGVFIRLGNLINQEIVGRVTSVPWAIKFDGYEGLRHPYQIYSMIKNLLLFFILLNIRKIKNLPRGFLFWSFIRIFSLFRFLVEFYKDTQHYLGLTIGQIISIPLIILAFIMIKKLKSN